MNISVKSDGSFKKTEAYLKKCQKAMNKGIFDKYGKLGVAALASATPVRTVKTASSWDYRIKVTSSNITIEFLNDNVNKHVNIAMILQYGHGTGTGGWVQGRDYINPAIQPLFDKMAEEVWKEVTSI